jgi:hypothetical protein
MDAFGGIDLLPLAYQLPWLKAGVFPAFSVHVRRIQRIGEGTGIRKYYLITSPRQRRGDKASFDIPPLAGDEV